MKILKSQIRFDQEAHNYYSPQKWPLLNRGTLLSRIDFGGSDAGRQRTNEAHLSAMSDDEKMEEAPAAAAPEVVRRRDPAMTPWVEKYRPATIDDVAHQDAVCSTLKNALTTGNVLPPSPAQHSPTLPSSRIFSLLGELAQRADRCLLALLRLPAPSSVTP